MKKPLGKLERIDLREYWKDEAREFTPWLASEDNFRLLGEAIGFDLELEGTEVQVGAFKADILARELETENRINHRESASKTTKPRMGPGQRTRMNLFVRPPEHPTLWVVPGIAAASLRSLRLTTPALRVTVCGPLSDDEGD